MPTFITPVDVTPGTQSAWVDVDVSAHVSADAVGVFLVGDSAGFQSVGWRKNGSTDDRTDLITNDSGFGAFVGVDGSQIFEVFLSGASIWLVGYVESSEGDFLTNGVDKTPGVSGSWQDVDISADTGADTAVAAFLELNSGSRNEWGLRKNGSTDDRGSTTNDRLASHAGGFVGCDGSEIFEARDNDNQVAFWLLGWLTDNVTVNLNAVEVSPGTANIWETILNIGSDAGAAFECQGGLSDTCGVRPNGSALAWETVAGYENKTFHIVGPDGSGDVQGYRNRIGDPKVWHIATFTAPAGGGGTALTPASLAVISAAGSPTLTQAHQAAPADMAVPATLAQPALTTDVQITPAPLQAAAALGQPPLTQAHQVIPGALQVQAALGASALTQAHTATPAALQVAATLQAAGLTRAHALSPDGLQVQGLLEAAALVQAHQLAPADLTVAAALDQASLSVQGVLTAAALTVAATLGQPGLTQAHQVAPADLVAATALDASSVQVAFAVTPDNLQVDATLAAGSLLTGLTVVPADLVVPSLLAEPGLVQAAIIDPADMSVVAVLDATNFGGAPVELLEGHLMVVRAQRRIMVVRPQRRIMVVRR